MNKKEIDILHGNMEKNIFLLALPIGIASCLQILFNAVDAIMVGRFVGVNALAAVSGNAGL
ncbi:MAG: MATE family efflux transporter, partial [Lachnospiraceae bacterium]|nr:MATE family efflux transporter [Lachnospiraceae bacterium]